jgi:hypothetical protein
MKQTYEQWLKELPDWLDSQREDTACIISYGSAANAYQMDAGGLIISKKVLDQTLGILRAITDGDVADNLKRELGEPEKLKRRAKAK